MYLFIKQSVIMTLTFGLMTLSGCSILDHNIARQDVEIITKKIDTNFDSAMQTPVSSRISESNGLWVNKKSISVKEDRLPAIFRNEFGLSFASRASLKDITALISRETGIRFGFASDTARESDSPLLTAGFTASAELRSLLDQVTAQANMSWRYKEGSVEIYRFETKVYPVAALPGITNYSATTSNRNTSGTGATASSSGQDSKYTLKHDFWAGLKDDIKSLAQNGSYSISESNNTVTVTGTPQAHAGVASYIKNLNALHMRQVAVEVRAYSLDLSSGRNFGLTWNLIYKNLKNDLGVTSQQGVTTPPTDSAGNGGIGLLSVILGSGSSSNWANSAAVLNSLSSMGNTTVAAESSQMTLSGESISVNSLREVSYLAEVTSTPVANAQPQVALKPATITEGFAMTLTPSIIGGDYIQISGDIDIASIDKFNLQSSGGQSIQTPERSTRSIPLRVGLKSGETYVFGLRQNANAVNDSGVVSPSILGTAFGGQHGSKESHKTLVVTVTPYIINPITN